MSTCISLSQIMEILNQIHNEAQRKWPFPLKQIEFIYEPQGSCAYETSASMQFNLPRIQNVLESHSLNTQLLKRALLSIYAHELIGHHRVTPLKRHTALFREYDQKEQVPYHFQYAILGLIDCINVLREVPLYATLLNLFCEIGEQVIHGKRKRER